MKKKILIFSLTIIFLTLSIGASSVNAGPGINIPYRVEIDEDDILEDDPDFLDSAPMWQLKSYSIYPRLQRYKFDKKLKVIKFKAVFEYTGDTLPQDLSERPVIGTAMCKVPNPYHFYETQIVYKGPLPLNTGTQVKITVLINVPANAAYQLRKNPATCNVVVENADGFPVQYIFEAKRVNRMFEMTFLGTNTGIDTDPTQPTKDAQSPKPTETTEAPILKIPPNVTAQDHIRGNKDATITLIEYSDLNCPFCKIFHPTMKEILEKYKNKVRWIYRHFPLIALHPNSQKNAEEAECANELGGETAFWDFIDELFATDGETTITVDNTDIAVSLGIDEESFTDCVQSHKYKKAVEEQLNGGVQAGVDGIPHTFILGPNGFNDSIVGAVPYNTIAKKMEDALGEK